MKRCIYCDRILNDDDVFCSKCGKKTINISELIDKDKEKSKANEFFECEEILDEFSENKLKESTGFEKNEVVSQSKLSKENSEIENGTKEEKVEEPKETDISSNDKTSSSCSEQEISKADTGYVEQDIHGTYSMQSGNEKDSSIDKPNSVEKAKKIKLPDKNRSYLLIGGVLVAICIILVAVFAGNESNSKKIVGYWKNETQNAKNLIVFKEDGHFCQYLYANDWKCTYQGAYSLTGKEVTLLFDDGNELTYQYEFDNNGNLEINDLIYYPATVEDTEFWAESETNTRRKTVETKTETIEDKIINLMAEGLAFDASSYIAGDVPAGDYAFVKFKNSGSYYEEDDAAGNILDNENFDSFGYVTVHATGNLKTRGVLVNVAAFGTLGVSGAKEIYEKLNSTSNYNQGGYYLVGADIPEGNYIVESLSGKGYYAILSGPVGASDIIDNDNFDGRVSIYVSSGQYVEVSRSTITQQ